MTHYFLQRLQVRLLAFLFFTLVTFASCIDTRKAVYFNNIKDTVIRSIGADIQPVIQKNDILSITVSSLNQEASALFNSPNSPTISTATSGGFTNQTVGYLVSPDGNILYPVLGSILAAGKTKKQLSEEITQTLVNKKLLVDPIVNIRLINFKVTVLGEVGRPNEITVTNEKITLLEALGLSGDLTIFGKRNNVLLIREENNEKIIHRINLTDPAILTSPFYYLKSNDVIYVEPNQARLGASSNARQILPIVLSTLSFVYIIIDRIFR